MFDLCHRLGPGQCKTLCFQIRFYCVIIAKELKSLPIVKNRPIWSPCASEPNRTNNKVKHFLSQFAEEIKNDKIFFAFTAFGAVVVAPVGRAFASETRYPQLQSSHRQILSTVNCIEKMKIKKKRPGLAHLKKMKMSKFNYFLFVTR